MTALRLLLASALLLNSASDARALSLFLPGPQPLLQGAAVGSQIVGHDAASGRMFVSDTSDFAGEFRFTSSSGTPIAALDFGPSAGALFGVREAPTGTQFGLVDPLSGAFRERAEVASLGEVTGVVASRPSDGGAAEWYVAAYDASLDVTVVVAGTLVTGSFAPLATIPGRVESLALVRTGRVLAYRPNPSELLQISTTDGQFTAVAIDSRVVSIPSMDHDPALGTLFGVVRDTAGSPWFGSIDPGTGAVTFQSDLSLVGDQLSLAIRRSNATLDAERLCSPAIPNASGAAAALQIGGSAQIERNDFVLTSESMPTGTFGLFLASRTTSAPIQPAGSVGNLCLAGAIGRIADGSQPFATGGAGTFRTVLDLGAIAQPSGAVAASGLDTWAFQAWFRDSSMGAATSNFSDAARVRLQERVFGPVFETYGQEFRTASRVTSGDLDGDGFPELVVTGRVATQDPDGRYRLNEDTHVMRLSGDRRLSYTGATVNTRDPLGVHATDLDEDGDLDLVAANDGNSKLRTFLNDGSGSFSLSFDDQICVRPLLIEVADLDGDGRQDIVQTCTGARGKVLFGLGGGTLSPPRSLFYSEDPAGIALVDVDGDGRKDVVALIASTGELEVRLTTANRQIGPPTRSPVGSGPTAIVGFDQDGDGWNDLVVLRPDDGSLSLVRGLGGGALAAPVAIPVGVDPACLTTADFNQDGRIDLAIGDAEEDTLARWLNDGSGSFSRFDRVRVDFAPTVLEAVDLDQDGHEDVVALGASNTVHVLWGTPEAAAAPVPRLAMLRDVSDLVSGDFDGDGRLDVLGVGSPNEAGQFFRGDGAGGFAPPINVPALEGAFYKLVAADLDADGDLDAVWDVPSGGQIGVALNDGSGGFTRLASVDHPTTSIEDIAVGDINRDGHVDLVVPCRFDGLGTALGDGMGGFAPMTLAPPARSIESVALADFDGDGWLDAGGMSYHPTDNAQRRETIHYNDQGTLQGPTIYGTSRGISDIFEFADLDLDGLPDMLSMSNNDFGGWTPFTIGFTARFGNGDRTVSPEHKHFVPRRIEEVQVFDFDRDGVLDVLAHTASPLNSEDYGILRGDGVGGYTEEWYQVGGDSSLAVGDFNGDGALDVVAASNRLGVLSVRLGRTAPR